MVLFTRISAIPHLGLSRIGKTARRPAASKNPASRRRASGALFEKYSIYAERRFIGFATA